MLYCRFCQDLNVLRKNFWENFPEKLPSEVSITNLVLNWDKSQLSWNNIDILSCILPNKANEIAILNSRRFIQRPIEHWDSVHKDLVRCGFFCLRLYLLTKQWDSVHKDLVTMCYSGLHLFLNVMSLAKNYNNHLAKSKRKNLRKSLHNESNFEFILLYCFRSTQNHQKRAKLPEKHCIHSLKSPNQVLTL